MDGQDIRDGRGAFVVEGLNSENLILSIHVKHRFFSRCRRIDRDLIVT